MSMTEFSKPARIELQVESQVQFHRPNRDFPDYGRAAADRHHALFDIVRDLAALGLSGWIPRLMQWLGQYDGLEVYADDDEDPHLCVRQVLANHRKRRDLGTGEPAVVTRAKIIEDLLALNFVHYRAHWGADLVADEDAHVWEPLKQSWFSFLEQGKDRPRRRWELTIVLTDSQPRPSLSELRAYLLQGKLQDDGLDT
jgi:hypothetical protein